MKSARKNMNLGATTGRCPQRRISSVTPTRRGIGRRIDVKRYPHGACGKQNKTLRPRGNPRKIVAVFGDSQWRPVVDRVWRFPKNDNIGWVVNCTPGARFDHIAKEIEACEQQRCPDIVFISAGTNNLSSIVPVVDRDMKSFRELLLRAKARFCDSEIIVLEVPPRIDEYEARVMAFNNEMHKVCKSLEVKFVHLKKLRHLEEMLCPDGVHLGIDGGIQTLTDVVYHTSVSILWSKEHDNRNMEQELNPDWTDAIPNRRDDRSPETSSSQRQDYSSTFQVITGPSANGDNDVGYMINPLKILMRQRPYVKPRKTCSTKKATTHRSCKPSIPVKTLVQCIDCTFIAGDEDDFLRHYVCEHAQRSECDDVPLNEGTSIKNSFQVDVPNLKGGARHARSAGRPPKVKYAEIAEAIVEVRKTRDANLSSDTFWKEVRKLIPWTSRKNESKMVKILRGIWCSNRGNIQNLVSEVEATQRGKKKKRRPKKLSNSWVSGTGRRRYCTCNSFYDKEKQYMCCDSCKEWYHYSCMNIPSTITKGTNVTFYCGVGECNNGNYVLKYEGYKVKDNKNKVCEERHHITKEPDKCRSEVLHTKPISSTTEVKGKTTNLEQHDKHTNVQDKNIESLLTRASDVSNPTVNILSGSNEPESNDVFFIKSVPRMASFVISKSEWCRLLERRKGRCLPSGEWQKCFLKELKKYNPYCVFMFKYHYVNLQGRSHRHFYARGYCKFRDCKLKIEISMSRDCECIVRTEGQVQHSKCESHSRPVRGPDRTNARNILGMGVKPMKLFLTKLVSKQDHVIQSGNRDDCGNSLHVMQKISSESRTCNRESNDELSSLISKMKSQRTKINSDGTVPGFIQQISAHPFYVVCFTEAGIRVWHDLCKKDVVFWDATGGCVHRTGSKKPMFYYELSVRSVKKGKTTLPVSVLLSEDHSLPTIKNWLTVFRHSEKLLYGHSNISVPQQINSDRAWVFLLASLQIFNNESMEKFLKRCWRILTGQCRTDDITAHTLPHACTAHFMKNAKHITKKYYKRKYRFGMYCVSLLVNARSLKVFTSILYEIGVVLFSVNASTLMTACLKRLRKRIENISVVDKKISYRNENSLQVADDDSKLRDTLSEDNFLTQFKSPFTTYFRQVLSKAQSDADKALKRDTELLGKTPNNPFHGKMFMFKVEKILLPSSPLWSGMMPATLSDISTGVLSDGALNNSEFPRTIGHSEQRMGVLKNIQLSRKRFNRVDEFIELITTDIRGLEIMFSDDIRRSRAPKVKNATNLIKETWHKKKGHSQHAVYQTKPSKNPFDKDLPTINPDQEIQTADVTPTQVDIDKEMRRFTPIQNLENNCWFNSVMQCFIRFEFMREYLERDLPLCVQPVFQQLLGVAKAIYEGRTITDAHLERTLQSVCVFCGFTRGAQCDASEFFIKCPMQIVRELGKIQDVTFSIEQCTKCLECQEVAYRYETGNLLQVTVASTRFDETITSLITKITDEHRGRVKCDKCKKVTMAMVTKKWESLPKVLMIQLLRYNFCTEKRKIVKDSSFVGVEETIQIPGSTGSQYSLSSTIQHIGENAVSGHYQTLIKTRNGMAVADDNKLLKSTLHTATCHNAYICVYERVSTTVTRPGPMPKDALHCIDSSQANRNSQNAIKQENFNETYKPCNEVNTAVEDFTKEDHFKDSSQAGNASKANEDVIDLTAEDDDTDETLTEEVSSKTIMRHYGVNIVRSDIDRILNKKGWLNDNVINCYLNIVSEKAMRMSNIKVYPFTTFFYTCFISDGYNRSSRLVKKANIFEDDILLVPVNYEFHWTLLSINNKTQNVVFYDSLFSSNATFHLESIKKYLMIELAKQHGVNKSLSVHNWSFREAKNMSKQSNSSDCGVCVCLYSEFETGLRKFPTWSNIELERERIAAVIQTGIFES